MDKGDKSSPSPGQNIFDTANSLLAGGSPFTAGLSALPFSHLSHLPSAFSMLGHHPAFPVTSLFGRMDGLGSPLMSPTSLAPSPSTASRNLDSYLSPVLLTFGQGQVSPLPDPGVVAVATIQAPVSEKEPSTIRSSLFTSSPPPTSSHTESKTTTATVSMATNSTSSRSSTGSSRTRSSSGGRGSRGGGRGRGRKQRSPAVPLSLVAGAYKTSALLSPSQLLRQRKREVNSTNGVEGDDQSDSITASSHHGDDHVERESKRERRTSPNKTTILNAPKSPTKILTANNAVSLLSQAPVHIDGFKKKLIADQIRQRVQNKATSSPRGSLSPPAVHRTRGRGRHPRNTHQKHLSPPEIEEQKRKQEELKQQLEAELKQQQMALRLMKKGNTGKDPKEEKKEKSRRKSTPSYVMNLSRGGKSQDSKLAQALSPTKADVSPGTSKQTTETLVAKFKKITKESSSVSSGRDSEDDSVDDSESGSDSSTGSPSDNCEDGDRAHGSEQDGASSKRQHDSDSMEGSLAPVKRRRVVLDENELRVPIDQGWKRQTNIHTYGRRGIVGEVWYFAPCGRKLKTIPDVMRYLDRNAVTSLSRDNFSFNTKVNVGEFYEARQGENGFVKLTETEITDRLSATVSRRMKKIENQRKQEKLQMQQVLAKQLMEAKLKQKLEQQDMARKVAEMQFQKRLEKQHQRDLLKRAKQMRIMEKRKQKEQMRIMKEREKVQRREHLRMEREMRAQQILENRRKQKEEMEQRKFVEAVRKTQERELKRQQAAMLKEQMRIKQERERRRQHMLLLKALEQRKKQEDRERQRESKIAEKRMNRERKVEQRRMEIVLAQELKKPREDMELRDFKVMPEFSRLAGNQLEGSVFAECLMVLEFLHNFGSALGFDDETLPTLKSLHDGIINKTDEDGEEFISLVSHLLRYALDDPGVPNPKEAVTRLGQKIVDMEVIDIVLSEVLRIFMKARNGKDNELSLFLYDNPVEACCVKDRSSILAFLCNELNCSKNITSEIEKQLEHMGNIRRDKWVVEGKLRRLRHLQAKKFHRLTPKVLPEEDASVMGDGDDSMSTTISMASSKQNGEEEEEKEDNEENESGNESDGGKDGENLPEVEEDDPTTSEECEKQIEKLQKQHTQYRAKVFQAGHKIRSVSLGQDRYKRRYWVLPCAGGVYVEGMESGETPLHAEEQKKDVKEEEEDVKPEAGVKKETDTEKASDCKVEGDVKDSVDVKKEKKEEDPTAGIPNGEETNPDVKTEVKMETEQEVKVEIKIETESEGLPVVHSGAKKQVHVEMNGEIGLNLDNGDKEKSSSVKKVPINLVNGYDGALKGEHVNGIEEPKTSLNGKPPIEESSLLGEVTPTTSHPPHNDTVSGKTDSVTVNSASHGVELKIPSVMKTSAIESSKMDASDLLTPVSKSLTDVCSVSPNSVVNSESKVVVNNTSVLSPVLSPPITAVTTATSSSHVTSTFHHICAIPSPSPTPTPPPAHSKKTSLNSKPNFMSIDSILQKEPVPSVQNNQFFPPGVLPISPFTDVLKSSRDSTDQKPWFSILPRVPCDDMSLTRGQHQSLSPAMLTSSPYLSPIPFRAFPMHSPSSFSSMQMGQLFGSPSDFNLSGLSNASNMSGSLSESSFKVPEVPGNLLSCRQTQDPDELLKTLQGEALPIPDEYRAGWWKLNDVEEIRQLQKCLHPRGIREKNLQKTLHKFSDYAINSLKKSNSEVNSLESSSESEDSEEEAEEPKEESDDKDPENKDPELTEDAEAEETAEAKSAEKTKKRVKKAKPPPVINSQAKAHEVDLLVLDEVEALEDKIASASLQIKGWKLQARTAYEESQIIVIPRHQTKTEENQYYPLDSSRERLLQLESNIERRYLKPPLCKAQKISLTSITTSHDDRGDEGENEILPAGLQTWRTAVATATSAAQLMLCVRQLEKSVSWEKSIMKVLCQICRKDDNEAELLLCDGCDRGYHTYCFKPKLECIPDGDWYCYECISKAVGESCCIVCGKRMGKMVECSACPRAMHIDCLDPPLPRIPRKWYCASCQDEKGIKKRSRKSSTASAGSASNTNTTPSGNGRKRRSDAGTPREKKEPDTPSKSETEKTPEKKKCGQLDKDKRKQAENSADMMICRLVLTEMEKHEDGWPFLQPVNCKEFTSYKKFIKHPMDFSTMKNKLRDNCYKTRAEFISDAQLVFENCKTFNEDDSEVGQCGYSMRKFLDKRWKELLLTSQSEETPKKESAS